MSRARPGASLHLRAFSRPRGGDARMAKQDQQSEYMSNVIGNAGSAADADLQPHVAYRDLREWIEEARKLGEIREVRGLSWQKDIGMAAEVILHDENAP